MSASVQERFGVSIRLETDKVDLAEARAEVRSIHGVERISQLFQFEVHLVSPTILDPYLLLDSKADIIFERVVPGSAPKEERRITGIIRQLRDRLVGIGASKTPGVEWANEYVLQIVPPLWTASLTVTSDVYQKLSVPKIVAQILEKQLLLKPGTDFEMKAGEYPEQEFVVEHNENHLNFISRLCEDVGIFYYVDGKKLVFGDKNDHFAKANPEKAQFRGKGERTHVFELEAQFRHVPAGFRVRDYNYRAPQVEVAGDHMLNAGRLGHVNEYGGNLKTPDDAKKLAKVRAETAASDYQTFEGRSEYAGFMAGSITEIEGHHAEDAVKGKMIITEVMHSCTQAVFGRGEGHQQHYQNEFRAIPYTYSYRPARLARKPVVPGLISAIVETEAEEKLGAIDDEGCYRLNFHQDARTNEPEGKRKPGAASRPVRMAQPSAGADRKFHFPLKSGTEVVVACVNGDPDRPIILGAVPDKGAKSGKGFRDSPVTKENKERLILKTNESELNVDDTEGKARWRTQVGDWAHVELIGEPEFGKSARIPLAEKGYLLGSENNYSAIVNEAMTLESTTYTALQAMSTVLTKTKHVDFVGEDPGFDDWKKFDEALAKAVEFTRLLESMLEATKKTQEERAAKKSDAAKKDHAAKKHEAEKAGEPEPGEHDKDPPECEECKKKAKELQEAHQKKAKASADAQAAHRKTARAQGKWQKTAPAGKDAAKKDLDAAKEKEDAAKKDLDKAQADEKRLTAEADQADKKCREAREKQRQEKVKKQAQEAEKKAAERAKEAEAHKAEVQKFWKRIDGELKEGKATEAKDLEKAEKPKEADKKDLWSKLAKDLADKSHKTHLADSQAKLKDAGSSLSSSGERKPGKAGDIAEPYAISVSKHSTGLLAGDNMFLFGDKHLSLYSPKIAHLVSGDTAHVKAEKGVEVSADDWVFVTAGKTIDGEAGDKILFVAKGSGGITAEAKMGSITGKAMKSIDLTADTSGVSITASLANIDMKASVGQLTGMGTAGVSFTSPATFSAKAGGMASMDAGGMASIKAGGAASLTAGAAITITAGVGIAITAAAAVNCTTPVFNVIGTIAIAGVALL